MSEIGLEREEPYWVVITKLNAEEYATAAVDAPTEEDAQAEGERIIASQEETTDYDVRSIRGPFPSSPGDAAVSVRPNGCHGCGLHCWPGDRPPCPHSTWFTRSVETGDSIGWECIQCGTRTFLPTDSPESGRKPENP